MADETENSQKRTPWMRIVLIASLAANFLIIGVIAGAFLRNDFRRPGDDGSRPPLRDMGYGVFGEALTRDDRRAVGRAILDRAGDLRSNREEVRAQIDLLLDALRSTPFDADHLRTLVLQQREKLLERQQIGQDLLLERIAAMSDEERRAFADRLQERVSKGFNRR